jgi:ribosomal protein L7/L12
MDYTLALLVLMGVGMVASLQSISRRLAAVQAQQEALLRYFALPGGEPSDAVRELARDPSRRIDAIRLYRQQTGKDLKEAVDVIDALSAKA